MKFPSKLLNAITVWSHIVLMGMRVCVCVCVCVLVLRPLLFPFHSFLPLFLEGEKKFPKKLGRLTDFWRNQQGNQYGGWRNYKSLRERVRFFHLNLLTFSYYYTDTAFVVWFGNFFENLMVKGTFECCS